MLGCSIILVLFLAVVIGSATHWWVGVGIAIAGFLLAGYLQTLHDKQRLAELTERFGADIAQRIMDRRIWQGATEPMIRESIGAPVHIDRKVLKTKTKLVYKYEQTGRGMFALRVTFENGRCVGWDDKR